MEIVEFIYGHFWSTICFLFTIGICISGIVLAFKGKNIWQ